MEQQRLVIMQQRLVTFLCFLSVVNPATAFTYQRREYFIIQLKHIWIHTLDIEMSLLPPGDQEHLDKV